MTDELYKDTTMRIGIESLVDADGDAVTDAVVTATIYDKNGDQVSGETWPVTLAHTSAGTYYGTVSANIDLVVGKSYVVDIQATASTLEARWRVPAFCKYST